MRNRKTNAILKMWKSRLRNVNTRESVKVKIKQYLKKEK